MKETHSVSQPENHSKNHDNNAHSHQENKALTTLTVGTPIKPNQPTPLTIEVKTTNGEPVTDFDTFQEKKMHLIAVSDDLDFFAHLHPKYQEKGRFQVEAIFPKPGNYTLFSDYKPAGKNEQVSVLKTSLNGTAKPSKEPNFTNQRTIENTKIELILPQEKIRAGQETILNFNLKNDNNQSVTDLQPYLGEKGHLVVIRQTNNLTETDYIHAHPLKDTPDGSIKFRTQFPQAGKYKLWGQFNRNGQILTADFWVNVV